MHISKDNKIFLLYPYFSDGDIVNASVILKSSPGTQWSLLTETVSGTKHTVFTVCIQSERREQTM